MKLQATLRRTLALLLVLIFALSNMGLAEVAEQVADIPVEAPSIEEAPVEDAAPEDSAPEAQEPPIEEEPVEAPVEEAVLAAAVAVEAYQIDETSLFADAAVENFDGSPAYQWQVQAEDGAWEDIPGATDAVYATEAEDRFAHSYRCVVTAGDVAEASAAVAYDAAAYDVAPMSLDEGSIGEDFGQVQLNAEGNGNLENKVSIAVDATSLVSGQDEKILIYDASAESGNTDGTNQITLTATVDDTYESDFTSEKLTFTWSLIDDNFELADNGVHSEVSGRTDQVKVQLKSEKADELQAGTPVELTGVTVTVSSDQEGDQKNGTATMADTVYVLAQYEKTTAEGFTVSLGGATTAFKNGKNQTFTASVKNSEVPLNEIYAEFVKNFVIYNSEDDKVEDRSITTDGNKITVGTIEGLKAQATYNVRAVIDKAIVSGAEGTDVETTDKKATFNVKPVLGDGNPTLKLDKTAVVAGNTVSLTVEHSDITDPYTEDLTWEISLEGDAPVGSANDYFDAIEAKKISEISLTAKAPEGLTVAAGQNVKIELKDAGESVASTTIKVLAKPTAKDFAGATLAFEGGTSKFKQAAGPVKVTFDCGDAEHTNHDAAYDDLIAFSINAMKVNGVDATAQIGDWFNTANAEGTTFTMKAKADSNEITGSATTFDVVAKIGETTITTEPLQGEIYEGVASVTNVTVQPASLGVGSQCVVTATTDGADVPFEDDLTWKLKKGEADADLFETFESAGKIEKSGSKLTITFGAEDAGEYTITCEGTDNTPCEAATITVKNVLGENSVKIAGADGKEVVLGGDTLSLTATPNVPGDYDTTGLTWSVAFPEGVESVVVDKAVNDYAEISDGAGELNATLTTKAVDGMTVAEGQVVEVQLKKGETVLGSAKFTILHKPTAEGEFEGATIALQKNGAPATNFRQAASGSDTFNVVVSLGKEGSYSQKYENLLTYEVSKVTDGSGTEKTDEETKWVKQDETDKTLFSIVNTSDDNAIETEAAEFEITAKIGDVSVTTDPAKGKIFNAIGEITVAATTKPVIAGNTSEVTVSTETKAPYVDGLTWALEKKDSTDEAQPWKPALETDGRVAKAAEGDGLKGTITFTKDAIGTYRVVVTDASAATEGVENTVKGESGEITVLPTLTAAEIASGITLTATPKDGMHTKAETNEYELAQTQSDDISATFGWTTTDEKLKAYSSLVSFELYPVTGETEGEKLTNASSDDYLTLTDLDNGKITVTNITRGGKKIETALPTYHLKAVVDGNKVAGEPVGGMITITVEPVAQSVEIHDESDAKIDTETSGAIKLNQGATYTLKPHVEKPADAVEVFEGVTWSAEDDKQQTADASKVSFDTSDLTKCVVTFKAAGEYTVKLTGYGVEESATAKFNITGMPTGVSIAANKTQLVGAGDSVTYTVTTTPDETVDISELVWHVENNSYGSTGGMFVLYKDGEGDPTQDLTAFKGHKSLTLVVPDGMKMDTGDKPLEIWVETPGVSAAGEALPDKLTSKEEIPESEPKAYQGELLSVVGAAAQDPTNEDLILPEFVEQAAGETTTTFTAKLSDTFKSYPVKSWKITKTGTAEVSNAVSNETVEENGEYTFTVNGYGDDASDYADDLKGISLTITATVVCGYDETENQGAGGPKTKDISGTVTMLPTAESLQLVEVSGSGNTATETEIPGAGKNYQVGAASATLRIKANLVGPEVTVTVPAEGGAGQTTTKQEHVTPFPAGDVEWYVSQPDPDDATVYNLIDTSAMEQNGMLVLPLNAVAEYAVQAKIGEAFTAPAPSAAAKGTIINIEPAPTSVQMTVDPANTTATTGRYFLNNGRSVIITAKPVDASGNAAYSDNLTWSTGTTVNTASLKIYGVKTDASGKLVQSDVSYNDTASGFATQDTIKKIPAGTTQLYVEYAPAENPTTNSTVQLTAVCGTSSRQGIVTLELRPAVTAPFKKADGSAVTDAVTIDNKVIAQGKTAKVSIDNTKLTSTTGVTYAYSIGLPTETAKLAPFMKDANTALTGGERDAAIAKWITVDANGNVRAVALDTSEAASNKFTSAYKDQMKFNIIVGVKGYETATGYEDGYSATIENVEIKPAPAKSELMQYDNGHQQDDETALSASYANLPEELVMAVNEVLYIKGKAVGPDDEDGNEIPTIEGLEPRISFVPSGTYVKAEALKTEDSKTTQTYRVTASRATGDAKVNVSATIDGYTAPSDTYTIRVIDETAKIQVTKEGDKTKCATAAAHKWIRTGTKTKAGHGYECPLCGAEGIVPHTGSWIIKKCDAHKDAADYHYTMEHEGCAGKTNKTCEIVCSVCGYPCTHELFPQETAERVDNEYHKAVCADCGIEIYQQHYDNNGDNICNGCETSSAELTVNYIGKDASGADAEPVVVDKDNPVKLVKGTEASKLGRVEVTVENAFEWTTRWSTDSSNFTVDPATGKIEGLEMTPADAPATLTAEIDVTTLKNGAEQIETLSVEVPVVVTVKPTSITVTADQNYVMAGKDEYVKVTADPGLDTPELTGFQWYVDKTKWTKTDENDPLKNKTSEELAKYIDFYVENTDKDTAKTTPYVALGDSAPQPLVVYIKAGTGEDGSALETLKGRLTVNYGPQRASDDVTVNPCTIDYYEAMDQNKQDSKYSKFLTDSIKFDKDPVAQGDTITVSMDENKYDAERYGTPVFTITTEKDADTQMTPTALSNWATISGNVVTVKSKGLNNDLSTAKTKKIGVMATVTQQGADGKTVTYKAIKNFTIVEKPVGVQLQILGDDGATWTAVSTAKALEAMPGDEITLRAVPVDKDGNAAVNDDTAIKADSFTWNIDDAEKFPETVMTVAEVSYNAYARKITLGADSAKASPINITVGNASADLSATLNVKPLIESITVTAPVTKYAIGEKETTSIGEKDKQITLTATTEPEDAGETYAWKIYEKDGTTVYNGDLVRLDRVNATSDSQMKLSVTGTLTDKLELVIKAETTRKNTNRAATEVSSNGVSITIYKEADTDALVFENGLQTTSKSMTVNESFEFTMPTWNETAGYGSTIDLPAPVVGSETPDAPDAAETTHVVEIVPQDGKYIVTAKAAGSAQIEVHAYNYATSDAKATMEVSVEPEVDEIELTTDEEYTIYVGQPAAETLIDVNAITPVYKDESGATTTAYDATVELTAKDATVVEVKKVETGWQLKGLKGGSTTLTASVGTKESAPIPVTVEDAPTGIQFKVNGEVWTESQKILGKGDEKITVTAEAVPAGAHGEVTIAATGANQSYDSATKTVTIDPQTEGTAVITAEIYNKDFDETALESPTNRKNLQFHLDVVVTPEPATPPTPPITGKVEIAGKKAIGVGESTKAVLTGVDKTATFQATEETESLVTIKEDGTIEGRAPGVAEIVALIDGEVAEGIEPAQVLVIEGISELSVAPLRISKNEVVTIDPSYKGYEATGEVPEGIEVEETGLFSIAYDNAEDASKVKLALDADNNYTVTGLAKTGKTPASFTLTAYNGQSVKFTVEVLASANKGFNLSIANSTLYMAEGDKQPFHATYTPSSTVANLSWTVTDEEGEEVYGVFTLTQNTAKGATNPNCSIEVNEGVPDGIYTVEASADGYDGIAKQSFTVVVKEKAEDATLKAMWKKVGSNAALSDVSSIELYKGEKAQIVVVDSANENIPVAGKVELTASKNKFLTLDSNVIVAKGTGKNATVNVTLNGKSAGLLTVTAKKAPTGLKLAVNGDTKATSLTVGANEQFKLVMTAKNMSGSDWYSVSDSEVVGLKQATDAEDNPIADTYTCEQVGVEAITLKTTWGATKTVQLTVKGEATEVTLPQNMQLVPGKTMRVKASFGDATETEDEKAIEAYANLKWTVNGKEVAKTSNIQIDGKKLLAKKISNGEIELTTTSKVTGPITVDAKAIGYDGEAMSATTSIEVTSAPTVPEGAEVTFAKHVIGKKEKIKATVSAADEPDYNFASNLEWTSSNKKIATVSKTGEVTGVKAGSVTITAKLKSTGETVGEPQTIYVIEAATITTNIWPKTMAEGETMTVLVTIGGYNDKTTGLPANDEQYRIITDGLLSATSNSDLIQVESFDPVTEDDEEPDGTERTYALVLKAKEDVSKDAKGKYPKATVAIDLSYKKNAKKQTIQVIEPPMTKDDEIEVYFPKEINLASGKAQSMELKPFLGDATNATVNFSWKLEKLDADEYPDANSSAVLEWMSIANGKLTTKKNVVPGKVMLIGTAQIGETVQTIESLVTVGPGVTNKSQFSAVLPKAKAGLSEKIQAIVNYTGTNNGGVAKWTSNKKDIATIDAATGMITTKKAGTVKFSLKVNGKGTQTATLVVVANESDQIALTPSEKNVKAGEEASFTVSLPGYQGDMVTDAKYKQYESAYKVTIVEGEELVDEDGTDLYAGKVKIVNDDTKSGKIVIRATSMTGKIAETVLSLGEVTGGEDQPIEPEIDKTPAKLEMWLEGYEVTAATQQLSLVEGQSIHPVVVVKNKDGIAIDAKPTWSATIGSEADTTHVVFNEDGSILAAKSTNNADTGLYDKITVAASVEGVDPVSFDVEISAKLSENNIKVEAKSTVVVEEKDLKVSIQITAPELNDGNNFVSIKSNDATVLEVVNTESQAINRGETVSVGLNAKESGTATLTIEVTRGTGEDAPKVTYTLDVNVIAGPKKDQITTNIPKDLKLTQGEVFDLTTSVADFTGDQAAKDFKVDVTAIDPPTADGLAVAAQTEGEGDDEKPIAGKWTLTAAATQSAIGKYQVEVTAYGVKAEPITVKVVAAPTITFTPVNAAATGVNAGAGEDVTLKYELKKDPRATDGASSYPQGLIWKVESYTGKDDPTQNVSEPTLEGAETDTVTVKFPDAKASDQVKVNLYCKNAEKPIDEANEITIRYLAVPTKNDTGVTTELSIAKRDVGDPDMGKTATIGVGEWVEADFTFDSDVTTENIVWESANPEYVQVVKDKDDSTKAKITGLKSTEGSAVTISANYQKPGTETKVPLGSVTITVVNGTKSFKLMQQKADETNTYETFSYTISKAKTGMNVKIEVDEGASAKYKLGSSDKAKVDVAFVNGVKNTWTLTAKGNVGDSATLIIRNQDDEPIKQYIIRIVA